MLGISILLLFIGYLNKSEVPFLQLAGYMFLLVISVSFISDGIDYKTGESETYVYGDNFSSYHWDYDYSSAPTNPQNYELFHTNIEYSYSNYKNRVIGVYLALVSAIGFIYTLFSLKGEE